MADLGTIPMEMALEDASTTKDPQIYVPSAFWQLATAILGTALLTGAGSWFLLGRDQVTRSEMERYSEQNSPYARERALLMEGASSTKAQLIQLTAALQTLAIDVAKLSTKQDQTLLEMHQFRMDNRSPPSKGPP